MAVDDERVYVVTSKGNAELNRGSTTLTAAELKVLVLVDGIATVSEIAAKSDDAAAVGAVLQKLARSGYVADPDGTASISVGDFFKASDLGLASLQANGYFVRIARRGPDHPKLADGQKLTVLAIEDDAQLAKLLRLYLKMESFAVRTAATRAEIDKALREVPRPDVVLLDVMLPDSDGFDVLETIRRDAQLKDLPVIMTTAKASREAVLKGLRGGANGYVTKPFDVAVVVRAVRSVLGLPKSRDRTWTGPT